MIVRAHWEGLPTWRFSRPLPRRHPNDFDSPDTARAEQHLARAVEIDPAFIPARLALAKLYSGASRLEDAARHLEQVVAAQPELAEAQYHLGRVYQRMKRGPEAQAAFAAFKRLSEREKQQAEDARRDLVRRLADVRF